MTTDRAVEPALHAASQARGGEVFVFKMPVATRADLVAATMTVAAGAAVASTASIAMSSIAP